MSQPVVAPKRSHRSTIISAVLGVLFSGLAVVAYLPGIMEWQVLALFGVGSLIAAVLRLGWAVPCMVLGCFVGFLADNDIKGGTPESQMWETVSNLLGGTLLGLVGGVFLDGGIELPASEDRFRFSLRALFISMTILAIVLGVVALAMKQS